MEKCYAYKYQSLVYESNIKNTCDTHVIVIDSLNNIIIVSYITTLLNVCYRFTHFNAC